MNQFAKDVEEGLSAQPKRLSSKYFYDKIGDQLFVEIMNCDEYYLTNVEFEIFNKQAQLIIDAFGVDNVDFDLIELGAGDGTKTIELLKHLQGKPFTYKPVDISSSALKGLSERLQNELPNVVVAPLHAEYFAALESLDKQKRKVILFLGSNLGNMLDHIAHNFMMQLADKMNKGDMLLLGLDLIKPAHIIKAAYNDEKGFTSAFNLNLLSRINKELSADFDLDFWEHSPAYDEENGMALSYLKSKRKQTVNVGALDKSFHFDEGELVHTEISRKYNEQIINEILQESDLTVKQFFYDENKYFTDALIEKTK